MTITEYEAYELENRLHSRSDREIIDDLKQIEFKSLLNTEECIESGINNGIDNAEIRKSLELLEIAISERCEEMIGAERRVKEILCNC